MISTIRQGLGPRFAGRGAWAAILLLSFAWLVINVHISTHFRLLNSDSILYGLPLAVSTGPLDLRIPFIGDFETYGRAWGHQWPGAMWVRASLFAAVPFSRDLDIGFLLICQWLSAFLAGWMVWKCIGIRTLAVCAALLVLSDRLIMTGVELHRFEALAGLSIMMLLSSAWRADLLTPGMWLVLGCSGAFLAPATHPYTGPLALVVLGALALKAFWFRECRCRDALLMGFFFLIGLAALFVWFYLQPAALEQYLRNVELQKSFSINYNPGNYNVVWQQLVDYRFQTGRILWSLSLIAAIGLFFGRPKNVQLLPGFSFLRFALPGLLGGVIFLHTVTRCNNHSYLTLGNAAAGMILATYGGTLVKAPRAFLRMTGIAASVVFVMIAVTWATITPYRVYQYARAGFPDLERYVDDILREIPADRKVYLSPPFWDAATRLDLPHEYRLWTFAIASSEERRARYEDWAYSDLKPGDILLVDRLALRLGDKWGFLPTKKVLPPDNRYWKKKKTLKRLFTGGASDFGYDFEVYEYTGP